MDDYKEVNIIDVAVNHNFEQSCYEDPLKKCLAHFGTNFDIEESIKEVNTLLDFIPIIDTSLWRPKVHPYHCQYLFMFHQSLSLPSLSSNLHLTH